MHEQRKAGVKIWNLENEGSFMASHVTGQRLLWYCWEARDITGVNKSKTSRRDGIIESQGLIYIFLMPPPNYVVEGSFKYLSPSQTSILISKESDSLNFKWCHSDKKTIFDCIRTFSQSKQVNSKLHHVAFTSELCPHHKNLEIESRLLKFCFWHRQNVTFRKRRSVCYSHE